MAALLLPPAWGQDSGVPASSGEPLAPAASPASDVPGPAGSEIETGGIDWRNLLLQSLELLGVEHGFRYMTEEGTRHPHVSFFGGYVKSLQNLHGWSDGDPFIVNYVGHPMQGSVAGFLFVQNDRAYRTAEFGKNRRYWKSRLRAAAYSWAYSEQFEIGPLSEATIGNVQAFYPQQGFADQVVTPAIGLGWMIGEDAVDKYIIRRIERHTDKGWVWVLVRGGLNPSRSLANALGGRVPWHRDTRLDPWERHVRIIQAPAEESNGEYPLAAPFEFSLVSRISSSFGANARGICAGGSGTVALRLSSHWQIAGEVGGCKMAAFGANWSGDSLRYLAGPRWTPRAESRWQPFAQFLLGGHKLTHEKIDPQKKAEFEANGGHDDSMPGYMQHDDYTTLTELSGLTVSMGAGIDLKLRSAIGLRVGEIDYLHSWHARLDGISYADTLQFTSGLILRIGTW